MKYKFYEVSSIVTTIQTRLVQAKNGKEARKIVDEAMDPWTGKDEIIDGQITCRLLKDENEVYGHYVLTEEGDTLFTRPPQKPAI